MEMLVLGCPYSILGEQVLALRAVCLESTEKGPHCDVISRKKANSFIAKYVPVVSKDTNSSSSSNSSITRLADSRLFTDWVAATSRITLL